MDFMKRIRNKNSSRIQKQQTTGTGTGTGTAGTTTSSLITTTPPDSILSPSSSIINTNTNTTTNEQQSKQSSFNILPRVINSSIDSSYHSSSINNNHNHNRTNPYKLPTTRSKRKSRTFWMEKTICTGFPNIWTEFRNNKELCDCTLKSVDGQIFHIHRAILSSASPYFRGFFNTPLLKRDGDTILSNFDGSTLSALIDFAYTGYTEVTKENVKHLLNIADQFQMLPLIQYCCQFIQKFICPENCLSIFKFCKIYYCPEIEKKAREYILYHFKEVIKQYEFQDMEFSDIEDYLRDDLLNIKNEEMVFEAIRSWIEYNPVARSSKVLELLQCVRFGLMSYRYFTTVVLPWCYIQSNEDVQHSLYDASMFLAQMDSRNGSELDLNDPLARPRVPHEIIFAIGGWSAGSPTSFMETYDSRADRWFLINGADVTPRAYHGLVAVENIIYMIGGFDGNDHFNTVQSYNPMTREWTEKSCMHFPRCYVSCCVLGRYIYAMGGFNGRSRMNSAERYDIDTNQWDVISPMNRQRSDASSCALFEKVYVAGGFNGQEVLNSVEVYDPKDGQWTFIHPMRSARSGVAITSYRDHIFALGGFNGFTRLCSGEKFNPLNPNEWSPISDMSSPRSNFATSVIDGMIFSIGGFNGTTTISYVECYDGNTNEWFDVAHMNLNRSALSACVLCGLPNAREYSYLSRVQELLGLSTTVTTSNSNLPLLLPPPPPSPPSPPPSPPVMT